jgi:hypothetical protein
MKSPRAEVSALFRERKLKVKGLVLARARALLHAPPLNDGLLYANLSHVYRRIF